MRPEKWLRSDMARRMVVTGLRLRFRRKAFAMHIQNCQRVKLSRVDTLQGHGVIYHVLRNRLMRANARMQTLQSANCATTYIRYINCVPQD